MKFFSRKRIIYILTIILLSLAFSYYQNNVITTTKLTVNSSEIPEGFDGYKIVHLSDLHSKWFGENQQKLMSKIKKEDPDIIVFTGDIIDQEKTSQKPALSLMQQSSDIAPTFFVTGNHEWWSQEFNSLEANLEKAGVKVLRNSSEVLSMGGDQISILGIDDPANINDSYAEMGVVSQSLEKTLKDSKKNKFTILLSHRPEMLPVYQDANIDLIFSGHAHGGQVRVPFIGGLIAPDQGLFPKYTAGKYSSDNSTMIVSRGLGNSIIPQRIFNRPEVVSVSLSTK
ncbi:metallophosphoesterase [Halobacillus salinus]|uniref:metallophosphoesterase n=1 Tax=Halobacillus salinus TaxID=192814 RepID=UPI0009A85914|nr:metallophosphoesterase [Halobacillus salinus]